MDRLPFIQEIFPYRTADEIRTIIEIVDEANPGVTAEQHMDIVFDMLNGSQMHGDSQMNAPSIQSVQEEAVGVGHVAPVSIAVLNDHFMTLQDIFPELSSEFLWDFCQKKGAAFDLNDALDEIATGIGHGIPVNSTVLTGHFNDLKRIFPDVAPTILWNFCHKKGVKFNLNDALDGLTRDSDVIWQRLKAALPGWDPSHLKEQAQKLFLENKNLEDFVNAAIEATDYPTMEEYLIRQKEEDNLKPYKDEYFKMEKFLETFPNPENHFKDPNRQNPLEQENISDDDLMYAKTFLYNKYPDIRKRHVDLVFKLKKMRLIDCCDMLDNISKGLRTKRKNESMPDSKNLELLKEVIYLKHRKLISKVLKYKDDTYQQFKSHVRALGLLETCGICGEAELLPGECFDCQKGCIFCKDCITRYVEVKMGEGLFTFPCCGNCDSEFTLHILQMAIPQHMFERLLLKIQSDEIKKANVEGRETCPYCDFTSIPPENSTIFKCENSECLKESCRLCRHESHIPKRCNEIEYDEDVRRRTYIENKMFEALARTCNNCQKKFVKSGGCNKMVCNCGAMMCYMCSQTITGYEHFAPANACQLITDDGAVDLLRVRQQAEEAIRELGNVEIKFNPTDGLENFFNYQNT